MSKFNQITALSLACIASLTAGAAKAGETAAIGGGLKQLVQESEAADPRLASHLQIHVRSAGGVPLVRVHLQDAANPAAALARLKATGFRVTAVSQLDPTQVEGFLPLDKAREVSKLDAVKSITAVQKPIKHAGKVLSQAVGLEKANFAQSLGYDGTGIRIGALSDSFDACATCTTHAADDVASGDLPGSGVTVLKDLVVGSGGEDEGRAMLQLVHDVAPGAQLAFATADIGEVDFANQILALRNTFGADIIVDDVGYFDEPMFSDGIVAQAVDAVVKSGAAYYSSAGNNGIEAYESEYRPVSFARAKQLVSRGRSNVKLDQIPAAIRPQTVHVFAGETAEGRDAGITQRFSTVGENRISFQWDEPFYQGKVKTDFNVYVFDADGNWMDPASASFPGFYTTDDNTKTDAAFEFVDLVPFPKDLRSGINVTDYQIVIGNVNNGPARRIKYVNNNGLGVSQYQGASSIYGHPAAASAQAVAAAFYAVPKFPEDFSSPGPVVIYFDQSGNRLREPIVRFVPQLTGIDGVDTTFFGGTDPDGNGWPNFFGTSAAAPDVAAVAALALQAAGGSGSLRPFELYRLLQRTATPIPVAESRSHAHAIAGPLRLTVRGDWSRWENYFGLELDPFCAYGVASVEFDTAGTGLEFSTNPGRFNIGDSDGIHATDVIVSPGKDGKTYTLAFVPGSFGAGKFFRFGTSLFNALQGSTQLDPDRLRGMKMKVTFQDGKVIESTVEAARREEFNRFTGAGLVDAAAAIRVIQQGGHRL